MHPNAHKSAYGPHILLSNNSGLIYSAVPTKLLFLQNFIPDSSLVALSP